jgi:hypothetical protein
MVVSRKKYGLLILCLLVVSASAILIWYRPAENTNTSENTPYTPNPYNDLNWWDMPRELSSSSDLVTYLTELNRYPNRHQLTNQQGYDQAAAYLEDTLNGLNLDVWYEGGHRSLVACEKGYGNDSRAIVFGAYLDTELGDAATIQRNSGGCAAVTLIAQILSEFRLPIDIYYCYFSYSKSGNYAPNGVLIPFQYGSREVSQYFIDAGVNVIAFYNLESVMYCAASGLFADYAPSAGYYSGAFLGELVQAALRQGGIDKLKVQIRDNAITDALIFANKGFPTIDLHGTRIDSNNPPADSIYSPDYSIRYVTALAQACASVAIFISTSGNGQPIHYKYVTALKDESSSSLWTVISKNQLIGVHVTTNSSQNIAISLQNSNLTLIDSISVLSTNVTTAFSEYSGIGPVRFRLTNNGNASVHVKMILDIQCDTDGNGISDSQQYSWPPPVPALDWDKDNLSDQNEVKYGTDIFNPDTDGDSMPDGYEVQFGLNPLKNDAQSDLDGDGLTNIREYTLGTNPNSTDTDNDTMPDNWEVTFGTNPLVNDSQADPDNDTLTNAMEYKYGSDPLSPDGDHDGLSDVQEIALGTNPLNPDSDGDGMGDRLEVLNHLNPLNPDCDYDLIPDGVDPNPRINEILVILGLALIPVAVGTILFYRRLK